MHRQFEPSCLDPDRMWTNMNNYEKHWQTYWRKHDVVYGLWHSKQACKLRNKFRFEGTDYSGAEFYFNAFVNEKLCYKRYSIKHDSDESIPTPSKPINIHNQLGFPYYELDKELENDKARLSYASTRYLPNSITKFIEPYSKKFYTHIANPGLLDQQNVFIHTDGLPVNGKAAPRFKSYCDVFSSSCGLDLHVHSSEAGLVQPFVPQHIRENIFKPAIHNLIQQLQVIELSRKSRESLKEMLRLAHERNVNLFVRYSSQRSVHFYVVSPLHTRSFEPPYKVFNIDASFLDLNHSGPISSEIFYNNPTLLHIKRKKYALRCLIQIPNQPTCIYCNKITSCPECHPHHCGDCGYDRVHCRHVTNLQLLRQKKQTPLSLTTLAGLVCRRQVSIETEKCYPNAQDISKSSMGKHPNQMRTPKSVIQYLECFNYDQEQRHNLVARFRLETNIEQVRLTSFPCNCYL